MAPPGVFFSLRVSQAIYAVATFALLCAATHYYLTAFDHVPWEVSLAMLSSCLSLVAATYMAYVSLSASQSFSKLVTCVIYWFVSFVSLVAFICLAKFLAGASECEGSLCVVTKISTVVTFFSYAVWAATILVSIEISKDNGKANTALQEKLKALSDE